MKKVVCIIAVLLLLCIGLTGFNTVQGSHGRNITVFDDGWKFSKLKDGTKLTDVSMDTSKWENITLPHTWNVVDGCDGWVKTTVEESDGTLSTLDRNKNSYFRGLGGYIKEYKFSSEEYKGKKIFIEFEGASIVTTLYVNGKKVGEPHKGGFSVFRYDITDYVTLDKTNIIAVTVDSNMSTDIAPVGKTGDYTKFGGLYRDVNIIAVDKVHIDLMDYGSDGVYVSTQKVSKKSADTNIKINVTNDSLQEQKVTVKAEIVDAKGKAIASKKQSVKVKKTTTNVVKLDIPVKNPHLWDGVRDPYLYSCKVSVTAGDLKDSKSVSIGYRYFSLSVKNGLLLNGKRYNAYGVNYHQDSYENGWAMTNKQRDRDYNIMEDMGVTAIRMAHYEHDPYEYDLCDKKGFVVWSETPLNYKSSVSVTPTDKFCDNLKFQMMEMIRQNYNHPSVIFYGIANELLDADKKTTKLFTDLCDIANKEDPSRITTYADNIGSVMMKNRSAAAESVGYNVYVGWYDSELGDLHKWLGIRTKNETRPVSISEYGAGGAITQHMDNPTKKDIVPNGTPHYEEYQAIVHEEDWAEISSMKNIWGSFVWCMFDFASDSRQEGDTLGQNDKGLVTRDRKTYKDAYYFYKSVWNPDNMVYITGKRFTDRKTSIPEVKVYSNALSVELFVNGKSYGVVKQSTLKEYHKTIFKWNNIKLEDGVENEVKAVATYKDGSTGEDHISYGISK